MKREKMAYVFKVQRQIVNRAMKCHLVDNASNMEQLINALCISIRKG